MKVRVTVEAGCNRHMDAIGLKEAIVMALEKEELGLIRIRVTAVEEPNPEQERLYKEERV